MCGGNRNDFYSTAGLNECLEYLLDSDCYVAMAVLLKEIHCLTVANYCDVRESGFKDETLPKPIEWTTVFIGGGGGSGTPEIFDGVVPPVTSKVDPFLE